jgi:hypothetical protein
MFLPPIELGFLARSDSLLIKRSWVLEIKVIGLNELNIFGSGHVIHPVISLINDHCLTEHASIADEVLSPNA